MEISDYNKGMNVELGVEESGFMMNQWPIMESLDELSPYSFEGNLFNTFSHHQRGFEPKRPADMFQFGPAKPQKLMKSESSLNSSSTFGILMSKQVAHSPNSVTNFPSEFSLSQQYPQAKKGVSSGTKTSQAQDHIIAERKRREKMSQRFIALSAIIPGLKKMDKASVLGDAIKYMKHLQEKVMTLEEKVQKKSMESVVLVKKKYQAVEEVDHGVSETLPEIEVKLCSENVLIRIHCEKKKKGIMEKVMAEIQKFHLSVINSNVLTFGGSTLDITILTKIDKGFSMTVEDIVTSISTSIEHIM